MDMALKKEGMQVMATPITTNSAAVTARLLPLKHTAAAQARMMAVRMMDSARLVKRALLSAREARGGCTASGSSSAQEEMMPIWLLVKPR